MGRVPAAGGWRTGSFPSRDHKSDARGRIGGLGWLPKLLHAAVTKAEIAQTGLAGLFPEINDGLHDAASSVVGNL